MKESVKNIENLIEKMMAEDSLQSPSLDFTSKIMSHITVAEKSKIKAYKPLISKSTWIIIALSLIILTGYTFFTSTSLYNFEMAQLYSDKAADLFSGIHFSKNILYSILIVPFMILIQIGVLKNYFDKKYEI